MSQYKSYSEKLLDPRWQRKRLEVLSRDEFQCQACGTDSETLHVHHRYYVSKREPWNYPLFAYETLCADCHKIQQEISKDNPDGWETFLDVVYSPNVDCAVDDARCELMLGNDEIQRRIIARMDER